MKKNYHILTISDKKYIEEYIMQNMQKSSLRHIHAYSLTQAIAILHEYKPLIILCDFNLIQSPNCDFIRTIRKVIPQCMVHILFENYNKEHLQYAMSFGVNSTILYNPKNQHFTNYIRLCELRIKKQQKPLVASNVTQILQEKFVIGNSLADVHDFVAKILTKMNACFSEVYYDIQIGLEELIINAIEHGNLHITYQEKSTALLEDNLSELTRNRQENPLYKNRHVTVKFYQTPEFDEWIIEDEGKGFDMIEISQTLNSNMFESLHGRGINISCSQFDENEFFNNGSSVRVRRYVPKY